MVRGLIILISLILGVYYASKFLISYELYYGILAMLNFQVVIILKEQSINIINFKLFDKKEINDE